MTRTSAFAICAIWLLAAASAAHGDVDLEIANGDRVTGSVTAAGGTDVYRVRVPAGALLAVSVKGTRRSRGGPVNPVTLRIFDEQDGEPARDSVVGKGKGARLRKFQVPATGEYRLVVGANAAGGDYKLSVKWKQRTRFRFEADTATAGPPLPEFGADAGSTVSLLVKAARKSVAKPRLGSLEGRTSGEMLAIEQPTDETATSHTATVTLTRTDTYQLITAILDDAEGQVTGRIRIKPDKTRSRLRLNVARLAAPGTDGSVFARGLLVGPEGATILFGNDAGGALIQGASVVVPAGAVSVPIPILIGSSTDVDAGAASGGGPSMFCGPSGTQFADGLEATVTMPFNPNAFDASSSGLKILQRDDAKGAIEEITQNVVIDTQARQVSFPVSKFSSFRIVGPPIPAAVPGDVTGNGTADLLLRAGSTAGPSRIVVFEGGNLLLASALGSGSATASLTDDVNTSASFGAGLGTADVNGDGTEDVVVSDPANGVAWAFFGGGSFGSAAASAAQVFIDSGDPRGGTGLGVGDVDDDAIGDIVLGVPTTAGAAPAGTPGAAFVFGGRLRFDPAGQNVVDPSDPTLRTLTGEADLDEFGSTVVVGDVTGDGLNDIVVAATRDGAGRAAREPGRVYVFPGASSAISVYAGDRPPPVVIEGATVDERFGETLSLGDVNGDGALDVVIGAPGGGANDNGSVHLFFGGATLAGSLRVTDADRTYTAPAAGSRMGTSVLCTDVTGDGFADIVTGAPGVDRSGLEVHVGAVFIFRGGRRDRDVPATGAAATRGILGVATGEQFGAGLSAADVDGDGSVELVVSAPFHAATPSGDEGRVYVFRGPLALDVNEASEANLAVTGAPGERLGAPDAQRLP